MQLSTADLYSIPTESALSKPCGLAKFCQTPCCHCSGAALDLHLHLHRICMRFPTTQSSCLHMAWRDNMASHRCSWPRYRARQSGPSDFLIRTSHLNLTDVRAGTTIKPSAPLHAAFQHVLAIPGVKITRQTCKQRTLRAGRVWEPQVRVQ